MAKSIIITVPHDLGTEVAKKRIAARIDLLRQDYIDKLAYSEVRWTDDRADFRVVAFGQTINAQLEVRTESLRIEVQLPWLLAALGNRIQGVLTSNAKDSLRIEHFPKKP